MSNIGQRDCDLDAGVTLKPHLMPDEIIAGSGTATLISAVLHAVIPRTVGVLEPAFSEYSRACASVKAEVARFPLMEEDGFEPDFSCLIGAVEERRVDLLI